ncbi:MAG TPA: dTDP-4-dehydrorhamnose 3,5-epimerase family protein [Xanthobacteraceae bacterium]|jgi:dTDP-4-dehydrorhamnose 3,5-epimerase
MNKPAGDRGEPGASLLDQTLAAASRDKQTVTPEGRAIGSLIEGVRIRDAPTHTDERGSVVEIYDLRWGWHAAPMVAAHCFTIRPGFVKGWGLHKTHEDRYFILQGDMNLVLYDARPDSSTYGHVCKILMSELNRRLVNIPRFVWHAEHNVGTTDVVVIDLPTEPYDHANPDKYRLPIDTPLIPHSFGAARGW